MIQVRAPFFLGPSSFFFTPELAHIRRMSVETRFGIRRMNLIRVVTTSMFRVGLLLFSLG